MDHRVVEWSDDHASGICQRCGPVKTYKQASGRCAPKCSVGANERKRENYDPERERAAKLRSNYGLTLAQFDWMVRDQAGVCAICQREPGPRGFAVDHDHACCPGGKTCGQCVRGLLCSPCNQAIGMLGDDVETIRRAASYLEAALSNAYEG